MYRGDNTSKTINFGLPSSLMWQSHPWLLKYRLWETQGMTSCEGGGQANRGEVSCLGQEANSLHLSGLEGLLEEGGDTFLLSPPFWAQVLERRSVFDRSREAKSRGFLHFSREDGKKTTSQDAFSTTRTWVKAKQGKRLSQSFPAARCVEEPHTLPHHKEGMCQDMDPT